MKGKARQMLQKRRSAHAIEKAVSDRIGPPILPPSPPLRVGTTAWRVGDPSERLTHEFHLALPCRPVHVGLIGAALLGVRIEPDEIPGVHEAPSFNEASVEIADSGIIRVDYDLNTVPGLRENLVVFINFEVTLRARGQVTILLIFETPASVPT